MKLLNEFEKQISKMDQLSRAWFTSFNANIEFIEKYILPKVVREEIPRTSLDYEALQLALSNSSTDIRIFCDQRLFETHRSKKTCVPVHLIRLGVKDNIFSDRSLFHPKVIYLEDTAGKRVIGTGSANLTVSGWGSNVEAFQFFEIKSSANYSAIRHFFNSLCDTAQIADDPDGYGLPVRRKFTVENENWQFVHSYQGLTFLDQLFEGSSSHDLAVWSPYLPQNLATYIDQLTTTANIEDINVHLVSDRINGDKLRTPWNYKFIEMESTGRLRFYRHPTNQDPGERLCHAKIWKLGNKFAVGSWNFTGPGSNVNLEGEWNPDNNLEAGFIIKDNHNWKELCGDQLNLGPDSFATLDLLETEGLDIAQLPPFDLRVFFDWALNAYSIEGNWLTGNSSDEYKIVLPGVECSTPLKWKRQTIKLGITGMKIDTSDLLVDRIFKITQGDKVIHRGVIYECNTISRRQLVCASLKSLLEGFVHDDDLETLPDTVFRGMHVDDGLDGDFSPETFAEIDNKFNGISYFRLFRSMQIYWNKLAVFDDLQRLDHQVFVASGCLLELVEKTNAEIKCSGDTVLTCFLAMEVSSLCDLARTRRRSLIRKRNKKSRGYIPIPWGRWKVELIVNLPKWPKGASPEYVKHIMEQYRNA